MSSSGHKFSQEQIEALFALGDVNDDGYSDFAVGSLGDDTAGTGFGSLTVFSGANGSILYKKYGTAANKWFGSVISNAGDVNADACRF